MEETQTASSPVIELPKSGSHEYAEWRASGILPIKEQPKAESAPAPEESADSAATGKQERPSRRRPNAEARIKQLADENKRIKAELEEVRRPKETKAESSSARPQTYQEWRKTFKPSKWVENYGKENPEATYEDANAAMADYLGDVREQFRTVEQQRQSQTKELNDKVSDARARYGEKFDEVLQPTVNKIVSDPGINPNVKEMINDSDVIADLIFTIGSDSKTLNDFVAMAKSNPGKALRYIAVLENGIIEELANGKSVEETKSEIPAKRGPESAPEPPIEIGARGSGTMSDSERAFQAITKGNANATRQWMEAENRRSLARRRGI